MTSPKEYRRDYFNGKLLAVKFASELLSKPRGLSDKIAYTLSLLLSEIFATQFPGNQKYIKIISLFDEDFLSEYNTSDSRRYRLDFPEIHKHALLNRLEVNKNECFGDDKLEVNGDNSFTLVFVEDSHRDVGLIKAISDKIEDILWLLQDYLNWLFGENTPQKSWYKQSISRDMKLEFLKYGKESVEELLALSELRIFLNSIFDENELTLSKQRFYSQITHSENEDEFDREYKYLVSQIQKNSKIGKSN
jgi:hypothetical protein